MILMFQKVSLQTVLPALLDDIRSQTTHLQYEGKFNPFNEIYKVSLESEYRRLNCFRRACFE